MLSLLQQNYIEINRTSLTVNISTNIYPIESVFSVIDSQELEDIFSAKKAVCLFSSL